MTGRPWSTWTADEHLDAAGRLFDDVARHAPAANGLHGDLIRAQAHVAAANVLAASAACQHLGPVTK